MMGLKEDVEDIKELLKDVPRPVEKKVRGWSMPLSVRFTGAKSKKHGKMLVIWLGSDRKLDFRVCEIEGGIIKVDDYRFKPYESKAVYHFKKWPVVVVLEDRLTVVGGVSDDLLSDCLVKSSLPDSLSDDFKSRFKAVDDFAQQTIVRVIEKVEIDKELGKKKGKFPIVWLVIGAGIVIYIISQMMGGGI